MLTRTFGRRPQPSTPSAAPRFAVQRFIQPKLTMGPMGDPLERERSEADEGLEEQEAEASGPERVKQGFVPTPPHAPDPPPSVPRNGALGSRILRQELARQPAPRIGPPLREPPVEVMRSAAAEGVSTPATTLPHLDRIQASFGRHSIGHVKAHVGPEAAKSSRAMSALAFASGDHVVFGGAPDLRTAAHEAAHVIQQQAGVQLAGGIGREGDPYERHADQVAEQVVRGNSAKALLDAFTFEADHGAMREPTVGRVVQPKLTNRAAISQKNQSFDWASHKSKPTQAGSQWIEEGLGAVLSTTVKLSSTGTEANKQLETLEHTVTPSYVDDTRPPLPDPPAHFRGVRGAYVVPSALLGADIPRNLLYLPTDALGKLKALQKEMIDLAKQAPGRLKVQTTFDQDLAKKVVFSYDVLDRITGNPTPALSWEVTPDSDVGKWATDPEQDPTSKSTKPTTAEWKTKIVWDAVDTSGDGTHVVADKLGPDHKLGSAPSCKVAADRVKELQSAAGGKEAYIAGHLLNDHLGGPGTLAANLAPIPKKANSQMSANIEEPAKRIVNEERGWIKYEVEVTHKDDPKIKNLRYPARIDAELAVYDSTGVSQGLNASEIKIDPPSKYVRGKARKRQASRKLTGTAIESSPQMLDEVILTQENDLRPFLRDSADLFELIYGSELSAHIENPKVVDSWQKVLKLLAEYYDKTLSDLNGLWTITQALEVWQSDALAQKYLSATTVGDLKGAVGRIRKEAEQVTKDANLVLADATAVVKSALKPSDLFKDSTLLSLVHELIRSAPTKATLLAYVASQEATTMPTHFHKSQTAKKSTIHPNPELEAENKFSDQYKKRKKFKPNPTGNMSPVHYSVEYGESVKDLEFTTFFGSSFESDRAGKATAVLKQLAKGEKMSTGVTVSLLLKDSTLKASKRLDDLLKGIEAIIGKVDAKTIDLFEGSWRALLSELAREEPDVAGTLYKALAIQ